MATQRERFVDLLHEFALIPMGADESYPDFEEDSVILLAQSGGVDGYGSFYARFKFDADGNFVDAGIWE